MWGKGHQFGKRQSSTWAWALAGACAWAPGAVAQMHHVDTPERVTRAIGVYEWTGELGKPTAARFVPVSLFINGHFEDAGLYLARPVPMALESGDVYALERAGEPQGLLDLQLAKRVVTGGAMADDNSEGTWYGFGKYQAETAPSPPPKLKPSAHLSTIEGTGAKTSSGEDTGPHMSRRGASSGDSSGGGGGQSGGSSPNPTSNGNSSSTNTGSNDDDQDRPTLRRRDPAQDAARKRETGKSSRQASVTAAGPALGEDPDRPILGHNSEGESGPAELTGLPADMHQAVGVSDATHNDSHPFTRAWDSPQEKAEIEAALEKMARPRVASYLSANGLVPSSRPIGAPAMGQATGAPAVPAGASTPGAADAGGAPPRLQRGIPQAYRQSSPAPAPGAAAPPSASQRTPSISTTRTHKPALQPPAPLTFAQGEVAGFTLTYGGLPTFVFTAAAAAQNTKASSAPEAATHPVVFVTVVAQRLPSGDLQLNLATVTDSAHLDRTPRLRLIDAVDPDDSHRASLLFELRGAGSRQFAFYRLTAVQAEQTFATASIE